MSMNVRVMYTIGMVVLLLALPGCMSVPAESVRSASVVKAEPAGTELIKGYRKWTRVNPEPVLMEPISATACAAPLSAMRPDLGPSPHKDKFIIVYVNELGNKAMTRQRKPQFPQGSVIVKEKLPSQDSTSPELLTVMIKREVGFNPENGDWEYMALDGKGTEVQARGRLEKCQACHTVVKNNDYVYRNYLTSEGFSKLK